MSNAVSLFGVEKEEEGEYPRRGKDITGLELNNWKVINYSHTIKYDKKNYVELWKCLCLVCNGMKLVRKPMIVHGLSKSCGCYKKLKGKLSKSYTHGLAGSPTYLSWSSMKARCYNPALAMFAKYGGRGITVCDRWLESFENFLEDMGERPSVDYSIDRIDGSGNYEPSNCRWTTRFIQGFNQKVNTRNTSTVAGVSFRKDSNSWRARISYNGEEISLGNYATFEEACLVRMEAELKYYGFYKTNIKEVKDECSL